jgi:hypothetical protein
LASLVAETTASGGDAIAIPADVAIFEQVKSMVLLQKEKVVMKFL